MKQADLWVAYVLSRKINDADLVLWDALYDAAYGKPTRPNHLNLRVA